MHDVAPLIQDQSVWSRCPLVLYVYVILKSSFIEKKYIVEITFEYNMESEVCKKKFAVKRQLIKNLQFFLRLFLLWWCWKSVTITILCGVIPSCRCPAGEWILTQFCVKTGVGAFMSAITKIFGTHSERELKRIYPLVDKVESYREAMGALSDEELKNKTKEYKERLENGETLDDLLPEAYATVREAAKRVLGMEHYRVQIIGGIILHQGRIAEMKTGEGKTLVSTLPAYLNALEGKGVCIVTVNDYLAKRDSEWMGQVHEFLGLKVGVVLNEMTNDERRDAYNCDITYVTNNELGFDYLRDNMVIYKEQLVQRGLHFAIIDEVDSVLIDEARTPLIISGQSGKSTRLYEACDILACQMKRGEDMPEYSKMDAIMGVEQEGDRRLHRKREG